jgi:hypothetical protein
MFFFSHRSSDQIYYFNRRKKTAFFCRFFFENIALRLEKQNEMFTAHCQALLVIGNKDGWRPIEDTFQHRDMLLQKVIDCVKYDIYYLFFYLFKFGC